MCKCLIKLISDQSSDVQSLAVKCLSPLVRKVHEERVDEIMASLCADVLSGTEEQRDICSIGLKTVVLEMPSTMAASAIRQLTPQLIKGVRRDVLEVKLECLEVLNDLLRRFAATLTESESRDCLAALFGELTSSRARKRSIACIASLSASLPDRMLDGQLVGAILSQLNATNVKMDLRRTYIQTLSAISRSGGYRLAKQVDKVIPLILQQCMPAASNGNGDPEMIESCLQAFESFVLRCPKEVGAYQAEVGKAALTYLAYDPNYADDEQEDVEEDEDIDEDEDEAEDYSDDDDVSWKVRRAAAKVLSSLIVSRPDRLTELLPMLLPTLINRFREREENVKMDIFATFNDLLAQVAAARSAETDAAEKEASLVGMEAAQSHSIAGMLVAEVPKIVKATARQVLLAPPTRDS
jgi:cullin-associated NEDD8-dissociated protein 1